MLIKTAERKKEMREVEVSVGKDIYGCDECRKAFKEQDSYLEFTIFNNGEGVPDTERRQLCSWKCVLKNLKKVKSNYFVSMPFLHYDTEVGKGCRAKDFLALVKTK